MVFEPQVLDFGVIYAVPTRVVHTLCVYALFLGLVGS